MQTTVKTPVGTNICSPPPMLNQYDILLVVECPRRQEGTFPQSEVIVMLLRMSNEYNNYRNTHKYTSNNIIFVKLYLNILNNIKNVDIALLISRISPERIINKGANQIKCCVDIGEYNKYKIWILKNALIYNKRLIY